MMQSIIIPRINGPKKLASEFIDSKNPYTDPISCISALFPKYEKIRGKLIPTKKVNSKNKLGENSSVTSVNKKRSQLKKKNKKANKNITETTKYGSNL